MAMESTANVLGHPETDHGIDPQEAVPLERSRCEEREKSLAQAELEGEWSSSSEEGEAWLSQPCTSAEVVAEIISKWSLPDLRSSGALVSRMYFIAWPGH